MPPLTPSRIRAISPPSTALGLVLVLELARRQLLEGDGEVVPARDLDHRRRVLAVGALGERVVVGVDLTSPLRRDDDGGVVGVNILEKLVDSWLDHHGPEECRDSWSRTSFSSCEPAFCRSSFMTTWGKSSFASSSLTAVRRRLSIASGVAVPRPSVRS